jgi:spermidine/putrescine transport system substrate-binding protein
MYQYAIADGEHIRMDRYTDRLNRRELLGAGAIALAAAACGGSTGGGNSPSVASAGLTKKKIEAKLNFFNWAQYHDPKNTTAFSKANNVKFNETNYTSNEELLTKLQTTKGQPVYDIIVPDADHVRIEKGLGLLMKLDHSLIPNLKNLAPHWRQLSYDPGNVYSVMKDTGLTGFTQRTDRVKANLHTWKDFFDFLPQAQGLNVNFIESPAEVIGVALNALGYSMNTESDKELGQARDLLLKVRPHVSTINEVYIDDFIAGKIDLGITYSGDGLRVRNARKTQGDILVVAPDGRSEIWIDNWAISAYAPDPVAAHTWINYMLEPAVNAREMEYVQYEVGTPASYPLVGAEAKDPLVVFPPRILNDYEILFTTPTGLNKRTAIWGEFKAA